jgi:phospholipase/lecithinase/hemolysin
MTGTSTPTVQALHAQWDAANQRVREHERLLAAALKLYEQGQTPLPQDLIDEVQAMRSDCNAKFKALLSALGKAPVA